MIITRTGNSLYYEGKEYTIGEKIYANHNSDWEGLFGTITEIRTGEDQETENETPDIYCCFEAPNLPEEIKELEERFSELYNEPKKIEDITLDEVIMAPEMIEPFVLWEQRNNPDFQREMYEAYREKRVKEDVINQVAQNPGVKMLSEENIRKKINLSERLDEILRKNDKYWEIYWDSIDSLICELVSECTIEREVDKA